ncbi:MAG TPA: class I SAM-dependent methyltransferase, partial [Treponemataceae bacterium]|nr:class I SAM-dependent methyltransferase [Treponemataceae bacterium]
MDDNKKFYDLKAAAYADEWYGNDMMLHSIKEFLSILSKKNPEVLDLGCGPGNESRRLQKEGAAVTGIDYSSESIKEAQKRNSGITFKELSYDEIDTTLGQFDGVFSCSSLIHLNENSLNSVLQKIDLV